MPPMPCMPTRASAPVMTWGFCRSTSSASRTRSHQLGTSEEVGRQAGHGEQRAERGVGLAQVGDELGEGARVVRVVAEVLAVEQAQLAGDVGVVAEAEDGGDDHVVALQGEPPFLADVGGQRGLRAADIDHAVHLGADGVLDLLVEAQPPRHQGFAVEPDGEAGLGEVGMEALGRRARHRRGRRRGRPWSGRLGREVGHGLPCLSVSLRYVWVGLESDAAPAMTPCPAVGLKPDLPALLGR